MKKFIERTQHGGGVNADLAKKSLRFVSEKGRGFRKQFSKTFLSGILTLTLLVTTVISADFVLADDTDAPIGTLDAGASQSLPAYFIGPSFSSANASKDGTKAMKLNGTAALGTGAFAGDIVLAANAGSQSGNAFLSRPIYSETGFSAMFEVYLGAGSSGVADGWSFIVSKGVDVAGKLGSGLGYSHIPNSFALGFKTHNTAGGGGSNNPVYVPAIGFGKDGSWPGYNGTASGINYIDERYSPKFKPGEVGVPFTADDVNALASNGATINNPGSLAGARNYSIYAWVDYNVPEDYIDIYLNIKPEKPPVPVIRKGTPGTEDGDTTGIPQSVGNSYYIGFSAGTGSNMQQMDLRQFYVLNSFAPADLEFTEDGDGLAEREGVTVIEDFTAPTVPVVTQKNANFTVGYSTDDTAVAKYQYRVSTSNGSLWVDGTANDGWKDYVFADGGDAGSPDLTAQTLIPFVPDGTPDTNTLVQARAVDTGGNISGASSYNWASQPTPTASLTNPSDAQTGVYPSAAQSISLNFSQGIDTAKAGSVVIEKTAGGLEGTQPSLAGGAVTANDSRWNSGGNALTLPLAGVEYGASYRVTVDGFVSTDAVPMAASQSFTFSTIARAAQPVVGIDYAGDALALPAANTAYLVNNTQRTSDGSGRIPLQATGTGAYDFHGATVRVVSPGDGTSTADSAAAVVAVPAKPAAPAELSGYAGKIYGITADMEYASGASAAYTGCTVSGSDGNGDFQTVATGTYRVRYKAVTTGQVCFASEDATIIVDDQSVSLNLTAPVFGAGGRVQQGTSLTSLPLRVAATGNIPASFANSKIAISNTNDFELTKPAGSDVSVTTIDSGEESLSINIRPKDGLAVGTYSTDVSIAYRPGEKDMEYTAKATVSLVVTERRPEPVVDYLSEHITGLAPSASYLVDGTLIGTNNQGVLNIDAAWFGRGVAGSGTDPLSLIKYNSNTGLQSDAASLSIKARPAAPASSARAESFTGFADGALLGVDAATMDYSNNGGATWVSDIASLPGYANGAITGLAPGDYRLRYKAAAGAQGRFASVTQTLAVAVGATAPVWGVGADTDGASVFTFDARKWGYADTAANALAHTIAVANTGNQPTGALSLSLTGLDPEAFALSRTSIDSIAVSGMDTGASVRPAHGLGAGTYTATLTVAGQESGQGGHSAPFSAGYDLSFTVEKANITGFSQIAPWTVGTAGNLLEDRDTSGEIASILLNGTETDPAFAGINAVIANIEGAMALSLPVAAWTMRQGYTFNPDSNGSYPFVGTLGSLGNNVSNTSNLAPTAIVVVNDLPYGILPDVGGTLAFADAEYGYAVGAGGVGAKQVAVTNTGVNPTGELTATLTGGQASNFVLASGGVTGGGAVQIASVEKQGDVSAPFTVQPVAGLAPGVYTATVHVSSPEHGLDESFTVSFAVTANKARSFVGVAVPGSVAGHAGAPAAGFEAAAVEATLLSMYPAVTANCTNGTVSWPVSAWTATGTYDPEKAGSYTFAATLGSAPTNHVLDVQAGAATLAVVIDPTVNAAVPNITSHPNGSDGAYTAVADPGGRIILAVAAVASDGGALSYQWHTATGADGAGGVLIDGATGSSYEVPRDAAGTYYYYCAVTNTNASVNGAQAATRNSNVAIVRVNKRAQAAPVAIEDPGAKSAAAEPYTFVLSASGGNGTGGLVFERTLGRNSVATVSPDGTVTVNGAGQIAVTAHRMGDADWEAGAASASLTVNIAKNAPDVVAPAGLTATYGDLLSSVGLSGFATSGGTSPIPGEWGWANPDVRVGNVGARTPLATFTPDDLENYEVIRNVAVALTVGPKPLTVDMGVNAGGVSFADKHYDGTTAVRTSGAPSLIGVVGADSVSLVASGVAFAFAGAAVGETTVKRTGSYTLTGGAAGNYTLSQPADSFANAAAITAGFAPVPGTHYTATPLNNGWTNETVSVTAKAGYKVSTGNADGSSWQDSLTLGSGPTASTSATFYVRRVGADADGVAQNEISVAGALNYAIDQMPPTVKVGYKTSGFKEFLNSITFGLFFKNTVSIGLEAEDEGIVASGVEAVRWYIDRNPGGVLDAAALEGKWQAYEDLNKPSVQERAKFALYVEALDLAGNSSGILTDGVVVYNDSMVNTVDIPVTRFAGGDRDAYVTLNGNDIKGVERTGYNPDPDNASSPGSVSGGEGLDDGTPAFTAGTSYTVSGNRITLDGGYLSKLKVGAHAFTVSYSPLGEAYPAGGDDRNEAPGTTGFTVVVNKAAQASVFIAGDGVSGGSVTKPREDGSLVLNASGGSGTGAYLWTNGDPGVATVSPETGEQTTATFTGYNTDDTTIITLMREGDADYEDSTSTEVALTVEREKTAPAVGGSGIITPSAITQTAATLTWTAASDTFTDAAKLTYYVYRSASDNIKDLDGCDANGGVPLNGAGGSEDRTTYDLTGLTPGEAYYYNVVAEDEAGNRTAYTSVRVVARLGVSYTAVQVGGKNGRETTTDIRVTFDSDVRDLQRSEISFTDAQSTGVTLNGAITEIGEGVNDNKIWNIPVRFTGDTINEKSVSVSIADWTSENGHDGYDLTDGTETGQRIQAVVVYGPVKWGIPTAAVDYVNERLTGLAANGTYKFKNSTTNTSYSNERLVDSDGHYSRIPFGQLNTDLTILRVGVPSGTSLTDDELGHTDSPEQTLNIKDRPAAPVVILSQPTALVATGGFTIDGYDGSKGYEYITQAGFNATSGQLYNSTNWTAVEDATTSGLSTGAYYVRVKAVQGADDEGSSFASANTSFYIHAYDELDFEGLEGYSVGAEGSGANVLAKAIEADDPGHTITDAVIKDGDNKEKFELLGDAPNFTVQPAGLLTRGEYTATVVVSYNGDVNDSETTLTFTVHPTAEWAADSVVASSTDGPGGLTDTLTLKFEYPIALTQSDIALSGAAEMDTSNAVLTSVGDDQKTYQLAVKPKKENKTDDDIIVTVNLGNQFAYQNIQSLTGSAKVTIPRAIAEAEIFPALPGYSTSALQFTLTKPTDVGADKNYYPIIASDETDGGILFYPVDASGNLNTDAPYNGPVTITDSSGTSINGLKITMILPIDEDSYKDDNGIKYTWTWRVFFTVNDPFTGSLTGVKVSLPGDDLGFNVEAVTASGTITKETGLTDARYILDNGGFNYLMDMHMFQKLDAVSGDGAYVAPEVALRTSVDLGAGGISDPDVSIEEVFIDIPGDDPEAGLITLNPDKYRVESGENKTFNFTDDPEHPVPLANQLVFVLNGDWTRTNGKYRIAIVFSDKSDNKSVAQGAFTVTGITPTRSLTVADGEGGSGSTAYSAYGIPANALTADGAFEPGKHVTITAGAAAKGYKFGSWAQDENDTARIEELPQAATGLITMPGSDATVTAGYIDGKAPSTSADIANNGWTKEKVALTATDDDVTKGYGENLMGEGLGKVTQIHYAVDGGAGIPVDVTGTGGQTEASLSAYADGRHEIVYYAVDESGNSEVPKALVVYKDSTPPSGSITVRGITYGSLSFSDAIGKFWAGDVSLSVAGGDGDGSGLAKAEYLVRTEPFENEAAAEDATGWSPGNALSITADGSYFVYARITDAVGNTRVVGTDGFVRYTQSGASASADFTKTSGMGAAADVAMHGNTVTGIVRTAGGLEFPLDNENYIAGNPVDEVKLIDLYLQGLDAGTHTFVVSYAPLGIEYTPSQNSDEPGTTTLTVTVNRQGSSVSLSAAPGTGAAYGEDNVVLTAAVDYWTYGYAPSGNASFYDDHDNDPSTPELSLGNAPVDGDTGEASLTATLGGGTHNLRAVYEGDGNYAGSEGGLASYDIAKAGQADVSISGAIDDALSAIYGDGPFMLTAVGGSGTGSYEWRIESDTSAATIGANSGRVNILAPGGAAVYVRRLGDGDYNPSDEVSVTLNVEKKAVTITGVKAEGKGYNGDTVAAIDLTEAGLEGVLGGDDVVLDASAATAAFAGANAGTGITVSFEGFTVDGGDAGKYALSAQPAPVKADIAKATPIWGSGAEALAAGGIRFGQRVEESALSGSVFGVGSSPLVLEGSLAWAPSDARSLPGEDDTVLNASGYTYNVVFTPEGADAVNYNPVTGSATLAVAKAVPRMAGEGGAHPQGSPIFANPPGNDTLADSAITGSVVYGFGGEPVDAEGVWSWDVANPSSVKFESIGQKTAAALFTPEDARIEALGETAEFVVYSPRTEIKEAPSTGEGVYGSRVGDIPFTSDGRVEAVSSAPGAAAEDITGKGSWSWADPDSRLDSTTGTQAAFAVFTPDNPVDFGEPDPEGYLAAEVRLTITVTPAEVSVDRPGDVPVPALRYGEEAISGIGLGSLGYVFSGPAALGDMDITGTLSWEAADPSAVKPGADGYGTSSDEDGKVYSARDDGVYYAPAVFTPGSSYGNAYKPKTVFVKIEVVADGASRAALADEVSFLADGGDSAVLPKINAAGENYPEDALKRLNEALGSAERALAPGAPALSQKDAEDLSAELQAAIEALGHDHPVLSHSAPDGVKGRGENVTISIKGEYGTVTMATLNGRDFVIGAESGGSGSPRGIMLDGRAAGTISKGSLVIDLSPDFIDSLPNGEYVLLAHFEDGYAKGDGRVLFEIARPEDKADGPSGVKKPAGPGGGPGSAGSGSDAGSGAGSTLSPDSTSGSGNSGGKDANPSGGKTTPIEDNEVNPGTSPWVWLAIALAAVALIIIIAALRRRRRRPQDGKN